MLPGIDASKIDAEEWIRIFATDARDRQWKTDEEAAAAACVSVRTLRTLQAQKLITAEKAPTGEPGGWRRMWADNDVAIAALAGETSVRLGWSIAKAARAIRNFSENAKLLLIEQSKEYGKDTLGRVVIGQMPSDWFLSVHDNLAVVITVPDQKTAAAVGATTTLFPFGVIVCDEVLPVLYVLENSGASLDGFIRKYGAEIASSPLIIAKCARIVATNSRVTSLLNISMPIRAACARMRGLEVEHADDGAHRFIAEHIGRLVAVGFKA